ncbi:MAG: DUF6125 family protein [Dehalococcoidia bacterium]|nr:DUF6125 family protein [Dehalococcoidia bacterium]MDD5493995.1 DUF6125 family protein [Dehalococcoidia bacterium]
MSELDGLEKMSRVELAGLALDFFRRSALHYGMWFNEVQHQLGLEAALQTESEVFPKFFPVALKRLSDTLGFAVADGLPAALSGMPEHQLIKLIDAVSANWLAADGIWFQAVEAREEMSTAKRCNDTCWTRFSPLEAHSIMSFLRLPSNGGLEALETALNFRLYSRINRQSLEHEKGNLVFKMVNCRVQDARKRKGLEDYPCKSAGVVEYSSFARTIDPRIRTECIACPPDGHPDDWFCAWRFYMA